MSSTTITDLPTRVLGKTGISVPILGLGTGEGGMGLPDDEAVRLYRSAIDQGITYVDTAPGYDKAQVQLARVLPDIRPDIFLTTKVPTSCGREYTEKLEQNLLDLQTDYVDLAFIHSVGSQDLDELLGGGGSLEALIDAKKRGLARFIGITAHNRPENSLRILEASRDLDVGMFAMNFIERNIYGFEDMVLPKAVDYGLGVAAMKVFGGAPEMEYNTPVSSAMTAKGGFDHSLAFRYALSLDGVATSVLGVYNEDEVRQNIEWARSFTPLDQEERDHLERIGKKAAEEWGERYGPAK